MMTDKNYVVSFIDKHGIKNYIIDFKDHLGLIASTTSKTWSTLYTLDRAYEVQDLLMMRLIMYKQADMKSIRIEKMA